METQNTIIRDLVAAKDIYLADRMIFSVEINPSTIASLLNAFVMGVYFSIFSLLLPAVKVSAFTIPLNQSAPTNPLNENLTKIPPTHYKCVNKAAWFGPSGFSQRFYNDCQQAWDVMDIADFLRYDMHTWLEFLSTGAAPRFPGLGHLRTPRRYAYGTCTWAIVSLRDIPPGQLPIAPSGPCPASDTTSFDEFFDSGLFGVESRCLRHGSLGYAIVGAENSLVILVTGTKSDFDRSLPRGVHPPPPLLGNVTSNALEGQNITKPVLEEFSETNSLTTTPQNVQSS